jgi:hypothetical protein
MTPRPVTDEARARVMALHAAGKGRNEIAREVGYSTATITKIVSAAGKSFDRSETAVAVAARVIDLKARRAAIVTRLFNRSEFLLARLEAPSFKTLVKIQGGGEESRELDFVPTPNERDLNAAIAGYLSTAAKLELQDSSQGAEVAKSMLGNLAEALGITKPGDDVPPAEGS